MFVPPCRKADDAKLAECREKWSKLAKICSTNFSENHEEPRENGMCNVQGDENQTCLGLFAEQNQHRPFSIFFLTTTTMTRIIRSHAQTTADHAQTTQREKAVPHHMPTKMNATAQETLNILVHRLSHARAAELELEEGTSRARAWASCHTKSAASSLHLPPVSMASTTSRQRPDATSSGYFASLSRLAWSSTIPFTSGGLWVRLSVFAHDTAQVMSIASWTPLKHCKSWANTSMPRSSAASDIHVHIAKIRVELDASPCLSAYSREHLLGGCGPIAYPPCARARCSVAHPRIKRFQTTIAHRARDGQREGQPLQQHHSEQVRGNRELRSCGTVGKRNAGIEAKVGPQMGAARSRAVGQHGGLPERPMPLAGIPCFTCVRPFALPQCGPATVLHLDATRNLAGRATVAALCSSARQPAAGGTAELKLVTTNCAI